MLTKWIDVACFVVGPVLLFSGLFDFSYFGYSGNDYHYYYPWDSQIFIQVGVALIALGLLRRQWLKDRKIA